MSKQGTKQGNTNQQPMNRGNTNQQPNQQPNQPAVCPMCKQRIPAKRRTNRVTRAIKSGITILLVTYILLSGLKTFVPTLYEPLLQSTSLLQKVDKIIPKFTKTQGTYIVPD